MEKNPWFRALLILLVFIAGLYLANQLIQAFSSVADVLLLFFLSWLIAFALSPAARWLRLTFNMQWWSAVLAVYAGLVLVLLAVILLIVPSTLNEGARLGHTLPEYANRAPQLVQQVEHWLGERGIVLPPQATDTLVSQALSRLQGLGSDLATWTITFAQGVATTLFNLTIILILSFYMLMDGERVLARGLDLLSPNLRDQVEVFLDTVSRSFGGYLRGVVIQSGVYGVATALIMAIAGLNFVALVSVAAAILMSIPIIGGIIAIIPPILIVIFTGDIGRIAFVTIGLIVVQQILLNAIMPKIFSNSVGLHPIVVFAALLIGGKLAGIWGALFGVPIAAVVYSMGVYFYRRNIRSHTEAAEPELSVRRNLAWIGTVVRKPRFSRRIRGGSNASSQGGRDGSRVGDPVSARDESPAQGDVTAR